MKKALIILLNTLFILSSCQKGDSNLMWYGPKEVSSYAQEVRFSPEKTVNVTFKIVAAFSFSDREEENIISQEEINCNISQKVIIENGKQKIQSDWYMVYQDDNSDIVIDLKECNCPVRRLSIIFDDTVTTGGHIITFRQVGK